MIGLEIQLKQVENLQGLYTFSKLRWFNFNLVPNLLIYIALSVPGLTFVYKKKLNQTI